HASGERTLDAGELLERLVGDVVGHVAQLIHATGDVAGDDLLLGGDVEQCVLHLQPAAGRGNAADHHVLGADGLPVAIDHFAGLGRQADHVLPWDRFVHAGMAQVFADDFSDVLVKHAAALPAEGDNSDRDRAVGATGNADIRFFSENWTGQNTEAEQKCSKESDHNARSSGVKVMVKER